jgi:hypothetical protein
MQGLNKVLNEELSLKYLIYCKDSLLQILVVWGLSSSHEFIREESVGKPDWSKDMKSTMGSKLPTFFLIMLTRTWSP